MRLACRIKVKKLKKYEQDFMALKGESIPIDYFWIKSIFSWSFITVFLVWLTEEQDNVDQYATELEQLKTALIRTEEEKKQLLQESIQVKEMLKRELAKADSESTRSATIISEYKQVNILFVGS